MRVSLVLAFVSVLVFACASSAGRGAGAAPAPARAAGAAATIVAAAPPGAPVVVPGAAPAAPAAPAVPLDASDGTSRCDRAFVAVTERAYVWVEGDGEEVLALEEVVARLRACADVYRLPRVCHPPTFERCEFRQAVVWTSVHFSAPGDIPPRAERHGRARSDERRAARANELLAAVQAASIPLPAPQHRAAERDLPVYRSRRELGASAALVPRRFDFGRHWLARVYVPSGRWQPRCLDELLGLSREAYRLRVREERAFHRHLTTGRVRAVLELDTSRAQGALAIAGLRPGEPPPVDGRCRAEPVLEAVLVPIPHTHLPVEQR